MCCLLLHDSTSPPIGSTQRVAPLAPRPPVAISRRRACSALRKGANFGTLVLDKMHARSGHKLG